MFIVAKQQHHLQTADRPKTDKSESRAKSKNATLNEEEAARGDKNKLARKGGSVRLKYPGRSQLNGHVRLIRAAETVKQAGGKKWKQERDVGSKVKTDGMRSAQN